MPELLARQALLFVALSLRPLALVFAARPFAMPAVPAAARVGLAAAIAMLVLPGYAQSHPDTVLSPALLVAEPLVGLVLAFSLRLAFAAAEVAGELLDLEAGVGLSQFLDPVTGTPVQMLAGLQSNLALVLYFSLGGHRALLAALTESYATAPLGSLSLTPALASQAVNLAGSLFSYGVRIALPVLTATTLTTVVLAAATRAFPEANAFSLGLPVKLVAAVLATIALLPLLAGVYGDLFASSQASGAQLLRLLTGS